VNAIKIRGLEISARHGINPEEKVSPQPFVFDADIYKDFYSAYKNDDLSATVNYSKACKLIAAIALENSFDLIETLAYTCANALIKEFSADKVSLTVWKPRAPVKLKFSNLGATVEVERVTSYLSLGSSQGDREAYIKKALNLLDKTEGITVKNVSSFIDTEPYGGVAENRFLNCAAEIETYLPPLALLSEIHRIEAECGRVRTKRWADRTLDIDIIFYGGRVLNLPELTVPHPEYAKRGFVLVPLKEIAPAFVCPLTRKRISDM